MLKPEQILYCDNHLLAVNKPAGLLTQDSGTGKDNLEDQAKAWLKAEFNKPGNVFLEAVHRIDRVVSGVVLFARTSKALSRLNEQMRAKKMHKVYHAVVEGWPKDEAGTLVHYLKHGSREAIVSSAKDKQAKRCVLHYRTLQKGLRSGQKSALLEIELETGRYHQIRAQLSTMGTPIVGDEKYGASRCKGYPGIALHSRELRLVHPTTKEEAALAAPYPEFNIFSVDG
ncbi:RluA family pseudouridine synthase [Verrucomicrobiota bacterium]